MALKKISLALIACLFVATTPHTSRAEDSRVTAITVTSVLTTAAGMYLLCFKKPESKAGAFTNTASGILLVGVGMVGILCGKEALAQFDNAVREWRWDNGDIQLRDLNPRNW